MNQELYIYWRLAPTQLAAAGAAIADWQAQLRQLHPGLQTRLLSRCESGAAQATLMETYALAGGLPATLQSSITEQGDQLSMAWRLGERHIEVFQPVLA